MKCGAYLWDVECKQGFPFAKSLSFFFPLHLKHPGFVLRDIQHDDDSCVANWISTSPTVNLASSPETSHISRAHLIVVRLGRIDSSSSPRGRVRMTGGRILNSFCPFKLLNENKMSPGAVNKVIPYLAGQDEFRCVRVVWLRGGHHSYMTTTSRHRPEMTADLESFFLH